jgi:CRP-like cAMP-binding protein
MQQLASLADPHRPSASPFDQLFAGVPVRRLERGACLLLAGAPATQVFLVRLGKIRLVVPGEEPGLYAPAAVLGPGHLVGLAALRGRAATYHASAWALTCLEAWVLPPDEALARLGADPALLEAVAVACARRLAADWALLRARRLLRVEERIAAISPWIKACAGEDTHLPCVTLAELVGARRETVSRALCGTGRT